MAVALRDACMGGGKAVLNPCITLRSLSSICMSNKLNVQQAEQVGVPPRANIRMYTAMTGRVTSLCMSNAVLVIPGKSIQPEQAEHESQMLAIELHGSTAWRVHLQGCPHGYTWSWSALEREDRPLDRL